MATEISGSSASIPDPLCDLDRLAHAMEARGLDGLVITTPLNVTYLSGFNPTARPGDHHAPERDLLVGIQPHSAQSRRATGECCGSFAT